MLNSRVNIGKMTMDELRVYYRELTLIHSECSWNGDYKRGNKAFDKQSRIFREIRERGGVNEFFPPLFKDESAAVRCAAAAHGWSFFPEISEKILVEIANGNRGHARFTAEMVLKGRKSGELWYDFERPDSEN